MRRKEREERGYLSKKRILSVFVLTLLFLLSLAPPMWAQSKPIELTVNLFIPPIHMRWKDAIKPWLDEIVKRTDGRVKFIPYFAQSLSPISENYDSVRKGLADMAEGAMNVKPGLFPLHEEIFSCTTPSRQLRSGTRIIKELHDSFPIMRDEFKDVKFLFAHLFIPINPVATSQKPVKTLDDLKGMKIDVIGSALLKDRMKALGATVVGMPMSDIYMSIDRGVVDGVIAPHELMVSRRWGDVCKHITMMNLAAVGFYMIMNEGVWAKLPKDIQKIIDDMSGDYALDLFDNYWLNAHDKAKKIWETKMGGQTYLLPVKEMAKVDQLVEPPVQAWVTRMESKGYPAKKILERFRQLEKKYSKPILE